jgi:hypothetical protein
MTAEEKIVKIKEILRNTVGKNRSRIPRKEIKKEILQFTIAEIVDEVTEIEEMIHDIYDVVEE